MARRGFRRRKEKENKKPATGRVKERQNTTF